MFLDAGPDSIAIPIGLIQRDGTRLATRGTFARKPITSGSATDALALSGTSAWFSLPFHYDPETIEFVVPDVTGAGFSTSQRWRCIRAQRSHGSSYWDTVEAILSDVPGSVAGPSDFSAIDFSSIDFATG